MIILNEKEYVQEHYLKAHEVDDKPYITLSLLAKYYYFCDGYRKKKIKELLTDYLSSYYYARYIASKYTWDETIDRIASKAGKYELYEFDCVWITETEIQVIDNIEDENMRLVAFSLLCLAKLGNLRSDKNNGWVNNDIKEIFELAGVKLNAVNRNYMLHDMMKLGLLEFPQKTGNLSSRVTFIDDNAKKVLSVSDFRALGNEYLFFKGKSYVRCAECGLLVPKKTATRYCPSCAANNTYYVPMEIKSVACVDCGKMFTVSAKNNKTCRCDECQAIYRRNYQKELMRERRNKVSITT